MICACPQFHCKTNAGGHSDGDKHTFAAAWAAEMWRSAKGDTGPWGLSSLPSRNQVLDQSKYLLQECGVACWMSIAKMSRAEKKAWRWVIGVFDGTAVSLQERNQAARQESNGAGAQGAGAPQGRDWAAAGMRPATGRGRGGAAFARGGGGGALLTWNHLISCGPPMFRMHPCSACMPTGYW